MNTLLEDVAGHLAWQLDSGQRLIAKAPELARVPASPRGSVEAPPTLDAVRTQLGDCRLCKLCEPTSSSEQETKKQTSCSLEKAPANKKTSPDFPSSDLRVSCSPR
jgi:hypothetical protein